MKKHVYLLISIAVPAVLGGSRAAAQVPVAQQTIHEQASDVAYDPVGDRYLVVWEQGDQNNPSNRDIYGRFVDTTGWPLGARFAIADDQSRRETAPRLACDGSRNECLVVFEIEVVPGDIDIWGYWISSATGATVAGPVSLASSTQTELHPAVAYSAAHDEYLAAWSQLRADGEWSILGRWVDSTASGGFTYGALLSIAPLGDNRDPDVACEPSSDCLAVWSQAATVYGSPTTNIAARKVGRYLPGTAFDVSGAANGEWAPAVTAVGVGQPTYAIAWIIDGPSGPAGTFAMGRTVSDTAPLGPSYVIAASSHSDGFIDIAATSHTGGTSHRQFMAVWTDPNGDIRAREFFHDGSARHSEVSVSSSTQWEGAARVSCDQVNECLATFDYEYSTSDMDVHANSIQSLPWP